MSDAPLTAEDVRAAAEVHGELGPDYGDAVVESFLAKIDKQIEARVDERLASLAGPGRLTRRRRPANPARLGKLRIALAGAGAGMILAGLPLTLVAAHSMNQTGVGPKGLVWIWVVLVAIYGLAAYRLRRR